MLDNHPYYVGQIASVLLNVRALNRAYESATQIFFMHKMRLGALPFSSMSRVA